jgi:hypothetical protein
MRRICSPLSACLFVLLAAAWFAHAQESRPAMLPTSLPTTLPAEMAPAGTVEVPGLLSADCIGFSPDGRSVYVIAGVHRLSLWRLLTHHWPEVLLPAWALLAACAFVRRYRRRQDPGHEHCGRCNYSLQGLVSDRCPECGLELTARSRVRGTHRRTKLALLGVAMLAPLGLYMLDLPRKGPWTDWLNWDSAKLADYAERTQRPWLLRHVRPLNLFVVAALPDGTVTRRVTLETASHLTIDREARVTHDGRYLVGHLRPMTGSERLNLAVFDLSTGRQLRIIPETSDDGADLVTRDASPALWVSQANRLRVIDLGTGRVIANREFPNPESDNRSGALRWCDVERVGGRTLVVGRCYNQGTQQHSWYLHEWDPRAPDVEPKQLATITATHWWADDRGNAYALRTDPQTGARRVGRVTLAGDPIDSVELPPLAFGEFSGDAHWLWMVTKGATDGVLLFDLRRDGAPHWIGIPRAWWYNVRVSPDGRFLVSVTANSSALQIHALP